MVAVVSFTPVGAKSRSMMAFNSVDFPARICPITATVKRASKTFSSCSFSTAIANSAVEGRKLSM
jgi:hypothetical protein